MDPMVDDDNESHDNDVDMGSFQNSAEAAEIQELTEYEKEIYDEGFSRNVYRSYQVAKNHFERALKNAQIKDLNGYFHLRDDCDFVLESETSMYQIHRN
eukprot:1748926-Rhodomonas_salina.1